MWDGFRNLEKRGIDLEVLSDSHVLLLPENIENSEAPELYQTLESLDLYKALKQESVNVKDYEDLLAESVPLYERRSDTIWLGTIVLFDICLPFMINFLSSYIYDLYRGKTIICKIRIPKQDGVVKIDYSGDSSGLIKIIRELESAEQQ